jgi:hypothetical protein
MAILIKTYQSKQTENLNLSLVVTRSTLIAWAHHCFILFGVFLLFQDMLFQNFKGDNSLAEKLIKAGDEIIIILCSIIFLTFSIIQGRILIRKKIDILIFLFFLVGIISSLIADVPPYILTSQCLLYLKGFVFYFILANVPSSEKILKKYINFFGWFVFVIFGLGLVDMANPELFRSLFFEDVNIGYRFGIPSVQSIFIHPGIFGWFMAFAGLYFFAFFLTFKKLRYLWITLLLTMGSLLSMRRKPVGGFLLGVVFAGTVQSPARRKRYLVFLLCLLTLLTVFSWSKFVNVYQWTQEEYFGDPMQVARVVLHVKSVEIAGDYFPLGAGFGRYGSWMSRVHYSPLYEEYQMADIWGLSPDRPNFINDTFWPMVLGETGIFGLILYLSIMGYFLVCIGKLCRKARLKGEKYIFAFLLGTFMIIVESLFESVAQSIYMGPPANLFIFGAIGLSFSIGRTLTVTGKK